MQRGKGNHLQFLTEVLSKPQARAEGLIFLGSHSPGGGRNCCPILQMRSLRLRIVK